MFYTIEGGGCLHNFYVYTYVPIVIWKICKNQMLCIALTFNAFTYYTGIIAAITFTKKYKNKCIFSHVP